jgi:hypothetical protein
MIDISKMSPHIQKHAPMIIKFYPTMDTLELADKLGLEEKQVSQIAYKIKVKKCPIFKRRKRGARMKKRHAEGVCLTSKRYISGPANRLIRTFEDNRNALMAAGQTRLAELAGVIAGMVSSTGGIKFDFLTSVGGWE